MHAAQRDIQEATKSLSGNVRKHCNADMRASIQYPARLKRNVEKGMTCSGLEASDAARPEKLAVGALCWRMPGLDAAKLSPHNDFQFAQLLMRSKLGGLLHRSEIWSQPQVFG